MTRTLIYDEVFKQFYDYEEVKHKPAGAWPHVELVEGDIVETLQVRYPQHFVEAALSAQQAGFVLSWLPGDKYSVVVALEEACPTCSNTGEVDSGGFSPWGESVSVGCPTCGGTGEVDTGVVSPYGDSMAAPCMKCCYRS